MFELEHSETTIDLLKKILFIHYYLIWNSKIAKSYNFWILTAKKVNISVSHSTNEKNDNPIVNPSVPPTSPINDWKS